MKKREIPALIDADVEYSFLRHAEFVIREFERRVYPVLLRFGLLDDEHIIRYLGESTTEVIFNDLLSENPERFMHLEQSRQFGEVDEWKCIRDSSSPVQTPSEIGFKFAKLPGWDFRYKETVKKALHVENCKISIDKTILHEASTVKPSDRQVELYQLIYDFCEEFTEKNYKKADLRALIYFEEGRPYPSLKAIMGRNGLMEK